MSQIKATFSGSVVSDPVMKTVGESKVLEFPVYVNHTKKDRNTGNYEPTGDVSKIRVSLWREKAEMTDVRKGDIVEVVSTLIEKNFTRNDGTEGRSLQTDWVESVIVKYRKDGAQRVGAATSNQVWNASDALSSMGATPVVDANAPF